MSTRPKIPAPFSRARTQHVFLKRQNNLKELAAIKEVVDENLKALVQQNSPLLDFEDFLEKKKPQPDS